jgi:drug/metabolite transporter (DMT)-like permease
LGFPLHARARRAYLGGGLGMFGGMILTYWGAQFIHSGLISVLFGLTPLITGLLALIWLGEKLNSRQVAGMLLGFGGLIVIFGDSQDMGGAQATQGVAALLAAVIVYSGSLVWLKRISDDSPPLATTAGTLAVALPLFGLAWWILDGRIPVWMPVRAGMAILYLGVFGSVLGFALYYYMIKHLKAGQVALATLITPVSALMLGSLLNGELVSFRVWSGTMLIALGLSLHQWDALAAMIMARR